MKSKCGSSFSTITVTFSSSSSSFPKKSAYDFEPSGEQRMNQVHLSLVFRSRGQIVWKDAEKVNQENFRISWVYFRVPAFFRPQLFVLDLSKRFCICHLNFNRRGITCFFDSKLSIRTWIESEIKTGNAGSPCSVPSTRFVF